jgi:hypothetical protein
MFRFTAERTRLQPPNPEIRELLSALAGNQVQIDRFAGITAGTISPDEFFAAQNMAAILGREPAATV